MTIHGDRLDELAEQGGFLVLPIEYMAEVMERPEEGEGTDDQDDQVREEVVVFAYDDLSKQRTDDVPPSYIPENFGIRWDFDVTEEPAPTDGRIALTVFDLNDGSEAWAGRERFAVTAIRQKTGKWWLDLVHGHGKEGGGTAVAFRLRIKGLAFEDVVAGRVEYADRSMLLESAHGRSEVGEFLMPYLVRALRFLQVGHEDARDGAAGKGDEPWPDGTGTVTIYGLGGRPTGDGEDVPDDFDPDEIVHGMLLAARADWIAIATGEVASRGASVSGTPSGGRHRWVNAFDFHRFLRRGPYPEQIPTSRFERTADHEAMLIERYIRDSVSDNEWTLRRIAMLQNPKRFTEADVEAAYGGAGKGVRPPKGGVYGWPETEGATERRDEMRAHFERALHHEKWSGIAGFPHLAELMEDVAAETWTWADLLQQMAAISDRSEVDADTHLVAYWRRLSSVE